MEQIIHLGEIYQYSTQDIEIIVDADTSSWTDAYVTFGSLEGVAVFEKALADLTLSSNTVTFTLTQAETGQLPVPKCLVQINALDTDGRAVSYKGSFDVYTNLHAEIIT